MGSLYWEFKVIFFIIIREARNLESENNNIEEITSHPDFKILSGLVLGRSDFVRSLGRTKKEVDSENLSYTNLLIH